MAYWKTTGKNTRTIDNFGLLTNNLSNGIGVQEYHDFEMGVVLDIILDEFHPIFSKGVKSQTNIDPSTWPVDLENKHPLSTDIDYSWIGRALIRPIYSEPITDKDQLVWAYPWNNEATEYPLINETVLVFFQYDKLYYTKYLNCHNWANNNLDFSIEPAISGEVGNVLFTNSNFTGSKESLTNSTGTIGYHGFAGQYFVANPKIRTVRRFEGDLLLQSRFGQTIHLTAYDTNRAHDAGDPRYKDYKDSGNPMILIRNRQRPLVKEGQKLTPHKKLPPIVGTKQEKNTGGFLDENVNHDGTSIHITSGQTISQYVTSCYKKMFGDGEEVSAFQGTTAFKTPVLNGDQVVVNTDRLILSSRYGESLHYSKKRYGVVTDSEYTVDAHQQIVLTTNTKTVINSPAIYLGEYDQTNEPAVLGQTLANLLFDILEWLRVHTHWYHHSHVDAGKESPSTTQMPVEVQQLIALENRINTFLSRRVFMTGGGFAPGQNGGDIIDGTHPVKISVGSGAGVPGGWKGSNHRTS